MTDKLYNKLNRYYEDNEPSGKAMEIKKHDPQQQLKPGEVKDSDVKIKDAPSLKSDKFQVVPPVKGKKLDKLENGWDKRDFYEDEDNKALKEDAAGGAWKGALVGGPVMNAVVNSRINKMYYACNDLPSPAKESCMAEMKRKYMEIMKANGVMPTDPVSGPVGGFAKGLIAGLPVSVGSAALDLAVPGASLAIAPFNMAAQAAYFKHAQDKINNMGYYCEKLLDPNDQLDCQQQLLDHKKMIYKQFMGVGDNSPAAVAPTSTPTEPAIPAAIEESFLNRFNYKKKVK